MNLQIPFKHTISDEVNTTPYILPIQNIALGSLKSVGGKAENLSRLINVGFPVPDGFCVTTAAYEIVASNPTVQSVMAELQNWNGLPDGEYQNLSVNARKALLSAPLPPKLEADIRRAYTQMDPDHKLPVAVRSSATAEDLPEASFAGLQDTYLNISGSDQVVASVRACWSSLWSDRAIAYRAGTQHANGVELAVVVQRLVPAVTAGVLFTANPLTGRRHETVIDAAWGLGEAVVSGLVVPDHFVIDTEENTILERSLGSKQVAIYMNPKGGTQTEQVNLDHNDFCLDDRQIFQLVELGNQIAAAFGQPQDIEWVIDQNAKIWVVQARPITTLYPLPSAMANSESLQAHYSINASQGMERPFTPLGESLFRLLVSSVASFAGFPPADRYVGPSFLSEAGGRLFLNISKALRHKIARTIVLGMVEIAESRAGAALAQLAQDPRFAFQPDSLVSFARRGLSFFIRARLPVYVLQSLIHPKGTVARVARLRSFFENQVHSQDPLDHAGIFTDIDHLFSVQSVRRLLGIMPSVLLPGMILRGVVGKLLKGKASAKEIEEVFQSAPDNPTMTMNLSLGELANLVRALPDLEALFSRSSPAEMAVAYHNRGLPTVFQDALAGFLHVHGHRCATELDGGLARWSEDPTPIFAILTGYLQAGARRSDTIFSEGSHQAELLIAELSSRARGPLTAAIVRLCLKRARILQGQREMPRFYIALLLAKTRDLLGPLGKQMVTSGRLADRNDLNFLSLQEIQALCGGAALPENFGQRRSLYDREVRRRAPPALLLSDGSQPESASFDKSLEVTAEVLVGIAASRGVVGGRARIIFDPQAARLEPGDILVAPSTDPGWTPLFLIAGGVVMETGGPMAHGAIVAREYRIPAIVAVPSATSLIRDGQLIRVDGTQGRVWLRPLKEPDRH